VAWVESHSLSFTARHESEQLDEATRLLDGLEAFRDELAVRFRTTPGEVAVVIHPRPVMLALAHPWLPVARTLAAPAARRYYAGWFSTGEIHLLAPPALERRAANTAGSREALMLTPRHEYAHLVLGANSPDLPPPFHPRTLRSYLRWAWLAEGAATHLAGQTPHLRPAITRRLREGPRPDFPPSARDALLLGGTLFELLDRDAAVELALAPLAGTPRRAIADAFGSPFASVERAWREHLDSVRSLP
jgi:hypothetical protein